MKYYSHEDYYDNEEDSSQSTTDDPRSGQSPRF